MVPAALVAATAVAVSIVAASIALPLAAAGANEKHVTVAHRFIPASVVGVSKSGSSHGVNTVQASVAVAAVAAAPALVSAPQPPYAVTSTDIVLTDTSRPTPDRGDVPGHPGRTMRTLVLTPTGAPAPLPVVVFAHGYNSEPETYLALLNAWATAGYLIVAPEFPGSAQNLPGTPTESDIGQQAQDVSFVITSLLQGVAGPVDPARIAVAGHSDGGSTVATLALDGSYSDPRISSYMVLSGAIPYGVDGNWGSGSSGQPLLCVVGEADEYGNLPATTNVFDTAATPKALVTVPGGDHIDTYLADTPSGAAVRNATVAYLDATIGAGGDSGQSGASDQSGAPDPTANSGDIGQALQAQDTGAVFNVTVGG